MQVNWNMQVNWEQLAKNEDLAEYFESDFNGFQQQIEAHIQPLQSIDAAELDKLALLRVLEVTNGCIQWAYRRQDEASLSVEQTRACMRVVIGFIQEQTIILTSGETIVFSPPVQELIQSGKELYQAAFKRNLAGKQKEYYAYSTAQFLVYGSDRIEQAIQRVQQEFGDLLTPYYIAKGRNYIAPYLDGTIAAR